MHHMYPGGKGDPLCPLGFHPQVRWPTRCKRCFRDYKEHGGKGKDEVVPGKEDMTKSTPSLSTWNSIPSRGRDDSKTFSTNSEVPSKNSLVNSNRLSNSSFSSNKSISSSSSWTSTPDLGNLDDNISTTVSVTLPRRRRTSDLSNNIDSVNKTAEFTVKKRTYTTDLSQVIIENESEDKVKSRSFENSGKKPKQSIDSGSKSTPNKSAGEAKKATTNGKPSGKLKHPVANEIGHEEHLNPDVEFILRVKSSKETANKKTDNVIKRTPPVLVPPRTAHVSSGSSSSVRSDDSNDEDEDGTASVADTETTETTLVGKNDSELLEEVESLRNELETVKARCERVEREKSDILLRRLASFDTASTKTAASEVLKLQQKLNELSTQSEDLKDDNKSLSLKVRELEKELEEQKRTSEAVRRAEELQTKLAAAETLCEELMDENEEMKKELRELEDEIEEMQDNFREDQADEYSSLKKELEQTTKNCRILSFKLRKSERKAEQLETEKLEAELKYKEISDRNGVNNVGKMKKLEADLKTANDLAARLTKELEEANKRLKTFENKNDSTKSQPNAAGNVSKPAKGEKVSRASLIRGGSQEDPQQLLRDLQDSLERETDLREQLRFAEEELSRMILSKQLQRPKSADSPAKSLIKTSREAQTDCVLSESVSTQSETELETVQVPRSNSGDLWVSSAEAEVWESRGDGSAWAASGGATSVQPFQSGPMSFFPFRSLAFPFTAIFAPLGSSGRNKTATSEESQKAESQAEWPSAKTTSGSPGPCRNAKERSRLRHSKEAANLRKKAARVEEDNDSLALQLKKMATKAKTARRNSPCTSTRTPRPVMDKEEMVSDEEDPTELKVLLELNEQESAVLRKKVEELETDSELKKKKIKELEEKLALANSGKKFGVGSLGANATFQDKEKVKVAELEIIDLKKKVAERENDIKRLENELELTYKRPRGQLVKSQSLDSPTEQRALDLRRQLELVEQEAAILRTKISTLESDNEKLSAENKKLQLLRATKKSAASSDSGAEEKISNLESKLAEYEKQINDLKEKLDKAQITEKKSSEVDRLKAEMKSKTDELEKLTKENKNIQETLRRLREDSATDLLEYYKNRKPKKPTDLTTKLQLKKMVEALENEVGDILEALKKSESEKSSLMAAPFEEEIEKKNKRISELEMKLKAQEKVLAEGSNAKAERIEKEKKELEEKKRNLEASLRKLESEREAWNDERKHLEARLSELMEEKKKYTLVPDEISLLSRKLEDANKQLEEEKANVKKLKKQTENMKKLEADKAQLQKDVTEKTTAMTDLKKVLTQTEEKLEKSEKNLSVNKTKVSKLEKTLEELEEAKARKEKNCKSLEDELTEMKENNLSLKAKIAELEAETKKGKDTVRNLEESIRKEREKATDACLKAGSAEKKEITALREDLSKKTKQMDEVNEKCEKLERSKKSAEESLKMVEAERTSWKEKASELESELNFERKKLDQMKALHEKETKIRDTEISTLKVRIKTLEQTSGASSKKMAELKAELSAKVQQLESELQAKKNKYEELTGKYELLEEEHVVTKAQLVMDKEHAQSEVAVLKKEAARLEASVKDLQESLRSKEEEWGRERKELKERIKGATERVTRASEAKWELERNKLQAISEEQKSLTEQLKQQNEAMVAQMAHMRKENEELRKKLDDFDKVSKIQRQISADTNQLDLQLREVRGKLAAEEKNHKSEMAALKLRYESRVNLISEELQASQNQLSRFKRERDTYKHMLEEAQVQMADLKREGHRRSSFSDGESKDSKAVVAALEQQVSCMEDELSEARLECSKLKTEFVSEKSAWEVKLSELQSRINELEEEKILSSGRTKVAGLRTKMELSWQKEREDQQRLLQETSTLARDLRQTLYEVERERDKERLESKRRQEHIKRTSEEEMEENRKKITELQCDLLELRDAHAKLRTTNEKLRREKEKWDKESRALQRLRIKNAEEERKISVLLDNIDLLLKTSFEKKNSGKFLDSSSKKRAKSKSRETSPVTAPQDENSAKIQLILQQLNEAAEDIRAKKQEEERDEDRGSRASSVGFRRAASTESDTILDSSRPVRRPIQRKNSLHRKSLSLSETAGPGAQDQAIWREEGNGGSLTSLEERGSGAYKSIGLRENSMDSRLSGGSTQSEVIPGDRKKKKSFFGKLKKLAKSRSIEDPTSSQEDIFRTQNRTRSGLAVVTVEPPLDHFHLLQGGEGSDSDISTASDFRGSKKDLKEKIAGIFNKDLSSKTNILEQLKKPEERKPKTLPRKSPGGVTTPPSLPPKSSTLGRPLDKAKNPAASLLNKP